MNRKIKEKLINILYLAFKDSWELGGGAQFRFKHGVEVAEFCLKISKSEGLNTKNDSLYLAGLFHDIGKVKAIIDTGEIDYESEANKNHENIDSSYLSQFIGEMVPDDIISEAVSIISEPISNNCSIERKVLKDADELGNFGFSQVWRTLNYTALTKQSFKEMIDFWKSGNLADRKKWINQLYFETSRKTAKKRYSRFESFLKIVEEESLGRDIKLQRNKNK